MEPWQDQKKITYKTKQLYMASQQVNRSTRGVRHFLEGRTRFRNHSDFSEINDFISDFSEINDFISDFMISIVIS